MIVKLCFELSLSLLLPRSRPGTRCTAPSYSPTQVAQRGMSPSLPSLRSWRFTLHAPPSRESANVVNRAIESPASINNRLSQQQQQHYDSSVTELRRKLARKASTFSLRSKSRRSQRYLRDLIKAEEESETSSVVTVTQEGSRSKQVDKEVKKSSATLPESGKFETVISHTRPPQQRREQHTSISMSSDISPPPVPFSRLQKIATQVRLISCVQGKH